MPDSQCWIRIAQPGDMDGILELYTHMHDDDEVADRGAVMQAFQAILSSPGCSFFILGDETGMISSCILHIHPNLTRGARPYGLIENVVTRKEYRSRGYGTRILRHALAVAWDAECYKVMLLTGRTDPAVFRMYQKAGFERGKKEGLIAYPPLNASF